MDFSSRWPLLAEAAPLRRAVFSIALHRISEHTEDHAGDREDLRVHARIVSEPTDMTPGRTLGR